MSIDKLIDVYFCGKWLKHPFFCFCVGFLLCLLLTA
jgi:hypothetical protein